MLLCRFLVTDLGISRYPTYTIERTMHAFPDRDALLAYEQGLRDAAALDAALEVRGATSLDAPAGPAGFLCKDLHAPCSLCPLCAHFPLPDRRLTSVLEQAEDEDAAQQALAVARATVQAQQHKEAWFSPHLQARASRGRLTGAQVHATLQSIAGSEARY